MQIGWFSYAGDNNGVLVPNGSEAFPVTGPTDPNIGHPPYWSWVYGNVSTPLTGTVNQMLTLGMLYPYIQNVGVYKCPGDTKEPHGFYPNRSISMNAWMNPTYSWDSNRSYTIAKGNYVVNFWKQSDIYKPAQFWVFIDENQWSINDGFLVCDPNVPVWIDIPANYHNGACGISFADGHAELKQWRDTNILNCNATPPTAGTQAGYPSVSGKFTDLNWLKQRSSVTNWSN
jgi:prepilin-type processing-associated H-X9-DG protein